MIDSIEKEYRMRSARDTHDTTKSDQIQLLYSIRPRENLSGGQIRGQRYVKIDLIQRNSFLEELQRQRENLQHDNATINAEFNPLIHIAQAPPIHLHALRAIAYTSCCNETHLVEKDRLKRFVDNYGATEEQMRIIRQCVADLSAASVFCTYSMSNLQDNVEQMKQ